MTAPNISLTPTQIQTALGLIDLAVKAGGLNIAGQALEIAVILQAALQPPKEPQE